MKTLNATKSLSRLFCTLTANTSPRQGRTVKRVKYEKTVSLITHLIGVACNIAATSVHGQERSFCWKFLQLETTHGNPYSNFATFWHLFRLYEALRSLPEIFCLSPLSLKQKGCVTKKSHGSLSSAKQPHDCDPSRACHARKDSRALILK